MQLLVKNVTILHKPVKLKEEERERENIAIKHPNAQEYAVHL